MILAACAGAQNVELPAGRTDAGQLCMFRRQGLTIDMPFVFRISADGEPIGRLGSGGWFCANLTPGEYIISARHFASFRTAKEIVIKRGERRFLELNVGTSAIIPATKEEALREINFLER